MSISAKMDFSAKPVLRHAAALGCKLTFQALDVNTSFMNTTFDLDPHEPPHPLENAVRNTAINNWNLEYKDFSRLATIDVSPQLMDLFFSMGVTSPRAIPMSALGDPIVNDDVIDVTKLRTRIRLAQEVTAI
ncbi:hypothetical protein F5Y12DRAFT_766326 [Xylaria sp. FL1777]|nr:hypothetical protein F5Y12DRAFT_766326 [Xylaria sp. FL1777]